MPSLKTTNSGSYPRIGDSDELQLLRKTFAAIDRKEKTEKDLVAAQNTVTEWAVKEQAEADLDFVTDGMIRWNDPISHLLRGIQNVEINGLLRFFDTNCYFRQPVIKGKVAPGKPKLVEEFKVAQAFTKTAVKPVLTGPFTLAHLSILESGYGNAASLTEDLADVVASEVEALVAAGAKLIQIDEPFIFRAPDHFKVLEAAIQKIAKVKGSAQLALYTYFGDASKLFAKFQTLPVDILGIDFTYNPKLVDQIASEGSSKALGLGLLDGRNTRIENASDVVKQLEKLFPKISAPGSFLNPSSGLEYLPRDRAQRKLALLKAVRAQFQGGSKS